MTCGAKMVGPHVSGLSKVNDKGIDWTFGLDTQDCAKDIRRIKRVP
jgi:hypothetical protein